MNKQFIIGWIVIFVLWMGGSFLVHGVLLYDDYSALPNLFRPEEDAQRYFHLMLLAHVLLAGSFVWIYSRGVEPRSWLPQGIRFGIAVSLLAVVPTYTIYYVVQPIPGAMAVGQIIFDTILVVILGIAVAFVYRTPAARTTV